MRIIVIIMLAALCALNLARQPDSSPPTASKPEIPNSLSQRLNAL